VELTEFKSGDLIQIIEMKDPDPVPSGTTGRVLFQDSLGIIHVSWENGRSLGVIPGEDKFIQVKER
jgi:hypothetical protein